MDTLNAIREQITEIRKLSSAVTLDKVLIHIERAEFFYKEGRLNGDENYFTDVIYRTNQAFEGSLRQSYMILAEKSESQANNKRTVDIEVFFETNSIFNERVLHFFKNYRQEWRNKSTHDFKLFFDQSEAFLAIVNVSAYIYVLLNQIIEKIAFDNEKERLKNEKEKQKLIQAIIKKPDLDLHEKVVELIKEFSTENELLNSNTKEIELIGMFSAFVKTASKEIEVKTDVKHSDKNRSYRLDMLVEFGKEKLIIEFKRPSIKQTHSHEDQLLDYLTATKIEQGILWYPKNVPNSNFLEIDTMAHLGKEIYYTTTIK